ncbi:type II CRISPR RNA-guided endonuclease Cas9 [Prosthecobacter sp.]|uniref:type II CRISPR RNA-guided endonuclease Cas9d n=1 Tax=Prosthecobacter sp. TaxID=1965333 RepID=UPI00378358E6
MSTIWAFDLGKGSIGEAVWNVDEKRFEHVASLLIPAEFASTKEAASRRRMMRTRQAHKAREAWLDEVWKGAGLEPLVGRRVGKVDEAGNWIPEDEWERRKGKWKLRHGGDEKLEREFPQKGDKTCYTSCLLRIKLLRGERLEQWQIYKALHSAIQKRGYGRVPWAARDIGKNELTEEELESELAKQERELAKKDPHYREAIEAWDCFKKEVPDERYHYPCYYDAQKQKLWEPGPPEVFRDRVDCSADSTRNVRFAREDVEKEVAELARKAAAQLPGLAAAFKLWKKAGWVVRRESPRPDKHFTVHAADIGEFFVHGPAGQASAEALKDFKQYLSFRKKANIHPGSDDDWLGATGQKTPRFDNRIVNDCALLDGMQVCKVGARLDAKTGAPYPDSLLPTEVTFLMKLKNIRVAGDGGGQRPLTVDELRIVYEWARAKVKVVKSHAKKWAEKVTKCYAVTAENWGSEKTIKRLGLRPLPGHELVKPPKLEGRSRFSRPALKLIRALILGGQQPSVFLSRLEQSDPALLDAIGMEVFAVDPVQMVNGRRQKFSCPRPYVLLSQLKFLRDLVRTNDTWEGIYLPEQRMDSLTAKHADADGQVDADKAIRELIGANTDPIVRHRLSVFDSRLVDLREKHGEPDSIALEFVRTDFMGEQAKRDLAKFQKDREKVRAEAKERTRELEIDTKSAPMMYELWTSQGFDCLYCGQRISTGEFDSCEVDHIVPRSRNGPDSMLNYVLAHRECNSMYGGKGDKIPFEWLHKTERWDAYVNRVNEHATKLRNKKVQLLLREDAPQLVERYTALVETAWVSRLAKKIVDLRFGWKNSNDGDGDKRVTVVSGGLTGRIRRKFKLNSILNPTAENEEEAEKKNRGDHRHHALDAMVISFLPDWMRDEKKQSFFRFPVPVEKDPRGFFLREIERVTPKTIAYQKAVLADTTYASRWRGDEKEARVIVQRTSLEGLAMQPVAQNKKEFSLDYLRKQIADVRDKVIRADLNKFVQNNPSEGMWKQFCVEYRKAKKDGSPGPRVAQVTVLSGLPSEYHEMSKDGSGAWRRGGDNHQGQIIYRDPAGVAKVQPIYAHASITREMHRLKESGCSIRGFFQSGCLVETVKNISAADYNRVIRNEKDQNRRVAAEKDLPPCRMILRSIRTNKSMIELTLANNTRVVGKVDTWMSAGLCRVN